MYTAPAEVYSTWVNSEHLSRVDGAESSGWNLRRLDSRAHFVGGMTRDTLVRSVSTIIYTVHRIVVIKFDTQRPGSCFTQPSETFHEKERAIDWVRGPEVWEHWRRS